MREYAEERSGEVMLDFSVDGRELDIELRFLIEAEAVRLFLHGQGASFGLLSPGINQPGDCAVDSGRCICARSLTALAMRCRCNGVFQSIITHSFIVFVGIFVAMPVGTLPYSLLWRLSAPVAHVDLSY